MEYITVREAAEKWGVSERRINQYCSEGRIHGTERFGGSWAIPVDAKKPGDLRKQKKRAASLPTKKVLELFLGFMPLMNTPFEPGRCMQTIRNMKAGPKKDIALAEYHYFSGQAEKAMQETEVYLMAADGGIRLSACWIYAYSCLTMGRIDHARNALKEISSGKMGRVGAPDRPILHRRAYPRRGTFRRFLGNPRECRKTRRPSQTEKAGHASSTQTNTRASPGLHASDEHAFSAGTLHGSH